MEQPFISKKDCWYDDNPKIIIFNAFKIWKLQKPLRDKLKEEEMLRVLRDMNT